MKKVLSLVLAIVMMASLLVVSTSAAEAAANTSLTAPIYTVGLSDANYKAAVANAGKINLAMGITEMAGLTNFGSNGGALNFYVDLTTLFGGFSNVALASDYLTATLTQGYSIATMTYSVVDLYDGTTTALGTPSYKKAALVTLTPKTGYVDTLVTTAIANTMPVTISFVRNMWTATTYVAQPAVVASLVYDVSDVATVTALSDAKITGKMYLMATGGNIISQAVINQAVTNQMPLLWNNMGLGGYTIAMYFNSMAGVTPFNAGATYGYSHAGINAPFNTIRVVDFLADYAIAGNPTVSVRLDADFLNAVDESNLKVYFIEDVEGESITVKGAKATLAGKATFGSDAAGAPIASFNLLNGKLGTYVVTDRELAAPVVEEAAPEVPNVNTGADNTVNVAIVLAVLALAAAGFVAVKKVK